jgi:hypothetical protein
MDYTALAELQAALRDTNFVRTLQELSEHGEDPDRTFAMLLIKVAEQELGVSLRRCVQ